MVENGFICVFRWKDFPLLTVGIKTQVTSLMKMDFTFVCVAFFFGAIDLIMCCSNVSTRLVTKCQAAWEQLHVRNVYAVNVLFTPVLTSIIGVNVVAEY